MAEKKEKFTGSDTEGGITSSYEMNDGVVLKVPYSFFGSIYDDDERGMALAAMEQDTLTMGPQVAAFQKEFAAMCGVKHAFAVSNCTTAMHVATQVFDIKPGDEVIVTPNTFIATSLVVLNEGGVPVFADIDPRTFNIDHAEIAKKVTPKTKAIYVVHYGGQMCDMDPIMEIARKHNLYVMEDCAHTPGADYKGRKAGTIGDIGCFSFHSLKNMSTCGEGGMITTNREEFLDPIDKLRCMNVDAWKDQTDYWIPSHFDVVDVNGHWGNNYRMNEIQAAANELVIATEQELKQVTEGVDLAHVTGESIDQILDMVEQTTSSAKEIYVATKQQRSATEQVVRAMKEVATVAQQTAAGSKQVAGSAEMLAGIARDSSQIGEAFKLVE